MVIAARFLFAALGDLADVARSVFGDGPVRVAEGSFQGNVMRPRATSVHRDVKPENVRPGLVPCVECGRPERPGAVHFASNTTIRPCTGSWGRR
jgi:hypothetical protein